MIDVNSFQTLPQVRDRIAAIEKQLAAVDPDSLRYAELEAELKALYKRKGELEDP